jgi:hypothetical protein
MSILLRKYESQSFGEPWEPDIDNTGNTGNTGIHACHRVIAKVIGGDTLCVKLKLTNSWDSVRLHTYSWTIILRAASADELALLCAADAVQ